MSDLHFLPWLRRGLAADITDIDTGQVSFARSATVDVWVEVDGERVSGDVHLRPADHVIGLDLTQVARRYPAPGATEVETGYWPVVEFVGADLPWAMTPLAPHRSGRLRPWIVLVCTPEAETTFSAGYWGDPTTITVDGALLPDLADSARWAHVQSDDPPETTAAAAGTASVVSRLVAPVTLAPSTAYRASLVAAFAATSDTSFGPAWETGAGSVKLTVFDTWTFTTGLASTFEQLVGLLGPVPKGARLDLGIRSVDVSDLGAVEPWPETRVVEVDYAGALVDTDVRPSTPRGVDAAIATAVTGLLNQGATRATLDPGDDDPVVALPLYGSFATATAAVPAPRPATWMRTLNLTLRHRMAAGIGADVVRRNQERYMARAWDQAGAVSETMRALNASRLQAEIGRTWKARADRLDDDQHAAVLRPQYTTVRSGSGAARATIAASGMPNGLFEPVLTRMTRPGSVVARSTARRLSAPRSQERVPAALNMRSWLAAPLGDPERRSAISFGSVGLPRGAVVERAVALSLGPADAALGAAAAVDDADLTAIAGRARDQIRPMSATRGRLDRRVAGLSRHLRAAGWPDDEVPTRVQVGPVIDEALVWALIDRSAELLMPGIGDLPNNTVRLVLTNPEFVAAFLAGANHEMNRELLWREYPADVGSTTFRRFWDLPAGETDVTPIAEWPRRSTLAKLASGDGEPVVVLARGDVFRLYPNLLILLESPSGVRQPPAFGGSIPPGTRFFAFDVESVDELLAGGWSVVFQEAPTEPRFGLDPDVALDTTNSARFAATSYQRPFSQAFPVTDIIGEGT